MLSRAHKFAELHNADRFLLLGTIALVATVRAALWLLPFRVVRRWVARASERSLRSRGINSRSASVLASAVEIAARPIPSATCLTQALSLQILLARAGHACTLRIGVLTIGGRLKAHAWVEHKGRIILGDVPEIGDFKLLPLT